MFMSITAPSCFTIFMLLGQLVTPLMQGVVDFSAGLGDALLLGFGDDLRGLFGVDGGVNKCSSAYQSGG